MRIIALFVWGLFNSGRSLRKTYKSPLKADKAPLKADRASLETDNPPPETTKLPLETDKPPLETDKTPPKTTKLPVQRQLQGGAGHRAIMPARFFFSAVLHSLPTWACRNLQSSHSVAPKAPDAPLSTPTKLPLNSHFSGSSHRIPSILPVNSHQIPTKLPPNSH